MKRLFDILASFLGIVVLLPVFIVIGLLVVLGSKGGAFYKQERIGRFGEPFKLLKFRSMRTGSDKKGLLTVGMKDARVTKVGYFIRKYKIDELPQLFNVLKGDMSLVGPRPEVKKYVDLYTEEQKKVLNVLPGITDYASLEYFNENAVLAKSENPEKAYIEEVMPIKLNLNLKYVKEAGFGTDVKIIFKTIAKIFS